MMARTTPPIVPDQVSRWAPRRFTPLGTDGFGRSDTREVLRKFFEIDGPNVVLTVLWSLVEDGVLDRGVYEEAIDRYGIDRNKVNPLFHKAGPVLRQGR